MEVSGRDVILNDKSLCYTSFRKAGRTVPSSTIVRARSGHLKRVGNNTRVRCTPRFCRTGSSVNGISGMVVARRRTALGDKVVA